MQILLQNILLLTALLTFSSCDKKEEENALYEVNYSLSSVIQSDLFAFENQNLIILNLNEISGLACGKTNTNLVYMIEDKGNDNEVHVFNQQGEFQFKLVIPGLSNTDWEDIAIGVGPDEGKNYIYIADIGDNDANRNSVRIIRFEEPNQSNVSGNSLDINDYDLIDFQYPSGPKDAEVLMLNPFNKSLIVVTKKDALARVYELKYPYNANMNQAEFIGLLPFQKLIAGDISHDGSQIVMKNKDIVYYWTTQGNNPLKTLFDQTPVKVDYIVEPQGESIGFSSDGNNFFTISETKDHAGAEPILYRYKKN
jgi:hypothetical protein